MGFLFPLVRNTLVSIATNRIRPKSKGPVMRIHRTIQARDANIPKVVVVKCGTGNPNFDCGTKSNVSRAHKANSEVSKLANATGLMALRKQSLGRVPE